jgi:hypothetical protein
MDVLSKYDDFDNTVSDNMDSIVRHFGTYLPEKEIGNDIYDDINQMDGITQMENEEWVHTTDIIPPCSVCFCNGWGTAIKNCGCNSGSSPCGCDDEPTLSDVILQILNYEINPISFTSSIDADFDNKVLLILNDEAKTIIAPSMVFKNLTYDSQRRLELEGKELAIENLKLSGTQSKYDENTFVLNNSETISINNLNCSKRNAYNHLAIGVSGETYPQSISISGSTFTTAKNYAIYIEKMIDGGTININNCHFDKASNCISYTGNNATITMTDCTFDNKDVDNIIIGGQEITL